MSSVFERVITIKIICSFIQKVIAAIYSSSFFPFVSIQNELERWRK